MTSSSSESARRRRRLRHIPSALFVVALGGIAGLAGAAAAAEGSGATWSDYLDHAYVFSSADADDLAGLLDRTTARVGRSLSEYHAETFPPLATRGGAMTEIQIRRKAIAELLLHRVGDRTDGLAASIETIDALADRLDRHENRYWFHTIHAHDALASGDAERFVDEVLSLWLQVVTPLEVPFETYRTLALNETGNAGFVRTLPHLYESIARLVLIHSQTAALDGDIDPLGAIVRVLTDERVGADPEAIPVDATSKDLLDHVVARLDGAESDGGSLSFTLALVGADRAHQRARAEIVENGLADRSEAAIRDSVAAYQRALRNANTLQGQVAVYARALRLVGEVHATAQRTEEPIRVDLPFTLERAYALHDRLYAARDEDWIRHGYVDVGREAYVGAMRGLWSEIQEATFNTASYYMSRRSPTGESDDESLVHAINLYSRYLHAFSEFDQTPGTEALPDSAHFGAYLAARGIGDGILFFAGGDASVAQLEEAISRYSEALAFFPFDRALWSTLGVALQRSGRESDFLAVAKPIADSVVHSRHLNRWIESDRSWSTELESFRRAFENDRSLVYFGFADESKLDELETEFARLQAEREEIATSIAATRSQRDELYDARREAHRLAAEQSGEMDAAATPRVAARGTDAAHRAEERSERIADMALEIERLGSSHERLDVRIAAIAQSLPIFKATLGHEALLDELAARRDHPVHALLRRFDDEYEVGSTDRPGPRDTTRTAASWDVLQDWLSGATQ